MLRADRAFGLLVLLALVSGAVLIALLVTLVAQIEMLAASSAGPLEHVVPSVLLLLAIAGIALGFTSLFRQLHATLRLIHSLLARRVPLTPKVMEAAAGLGLDDRIDLVLDERPFSFCYWFIRPRICLSTSLVRRLDADELRAVLFHERYHLAHRDPLRLVIARYFAAGLYVIPVVEDLLVHFTLEKELEADQDAVRAMGDVRPLARALDALLPDADAVSLGLLVPVGSLSVTEARIEHLVDGRPLPVAIRPASVALSLGALVAAVALVAVEGPSMAPASLLVAAAMSGGAQQVRIVVQRGA